MLLQTSLSRILFAVVLCTFVNPTLHFASNTRGGHSTLGHECGHSDTYFSQKCIFFSRKVAEFEIWVHIHLGNFQPSPGNKAVYRICTYSKGTHSFSSVLLL